MIRPTTAPSCRPGLKKCAAEVGDCPFELAHARLLALCAQYMLCQHSQQKPKHLLVHEIRSWCCRVVVAG